MASLQVDVGSDIEHKGPVNEAETYERQDLRVRVANKHRGCHASGHGNNHAGIVQAGWGADLAASFTHVTWGPTCAKVVPVLDIIAFIKTYICVLYVCMYVCTYVCTCMHACMDGWMDGWMGGWVDEWMYACFFCVQYMFLCLYVYLFPCNVCVNT